jgi:hypothetical protein
LNYSSAFSDILWKFIQFESLSGSLNSSSTRKNLFNWKKSEEQQRLSRPRERIRLKASPGPRECKLKFQIECQREENKKVYFPGKKLRLHEEEAGAEKRFALTWRQKLLIYSLFVSFAETQSIKTP